MEYLIYIGRFQPFHEGHLFTVREALRLAPKLIILLGSSQESRTLKNIWTATEREIMIRSALTATENDRIQIAPIVDMPNQDEAWRDDIMQKVQQLSTSAAQLGIIGHSKDSSSYYLNLFSSWQRVELGNYQGISATPLREMYLRGKEKIPHLTPSVMQFLRDFRQTEDYQRLQALHGKD